MFSQTRLLLGCFRLVNPEFDFPIQHENQKLIFPNRKMDITIGKIRFELHVLLGNPTLGSPDRNHPYSYFKWRSSAIKIDLQVYSLFSAF